MGIKTLAKLHNTPVARAKRRRNHDRNMAARAELNRSRRSMDQGTYHQRQLEISRGLA